MVKSYIYTLLTIAMLAPAMVWAGYDEGSQAANKGAYTTAFKEFKAAAVSGDARAQYSLAVMYNDGIGVKKNLEESLRWFRQAAAQGHPLAIEILKQKSK